MSWCNVCQQGFEAQTQAGAGATASGATVVQCPTCGWAASGSDEAVFDEAAPQNHPEAGHPGQSGHPVQTSRPNRTGPPWHFWAVIGAATIYLGWRAIEGVVRLVQWIL